MATNSHFGHSGQSEMSENGPNGFSMAKNQGIATKINHVQNHSYKFGHFMLILTAKMAILATQVNMRCLKMVSLDVPWSKTWG